MKIDAKTTAKARELMKKHGKKEIYVKAENGHMYFNKNSAMASVGNDEEKLVHISVAEEKSTAGKDPSPLTLLRARYKELNEKKADNKWGEAQLTEKIKALEDAALKNAGAGSTDTGDNKEEGGN